MSPPRRARSASVASTCSRRFFSRMTCWDFCGFDHRFGSAACFSISASWGRILSASKILPEFVHLLAQLFVRLFQFLIHEDGQPFCGFSVLRFLEYMKREISAPAEIIAHAHANQSPWRV